MFVLFFLLVRFKKNLPPESNCAFAVALTGTRVHFVIFAIFIKIKYNPF
jgi:hypothetical protein